MLSLSRRAVFMSLTSGLVLAGLPAAHARLVILGGGPAGASAALAVKRQAPAQEVILIERDPTRLGHAPRMAQPFQRPDAGPDLAMLRQAGVKIVLDEVSEIDWSAARLETISGRRLAFDQLMIAPGTAPMPETIPGLDARTRHLWPAAWGNPREARRLHAQLNTLPEDGHLVLRLPAAPSHPEAVIKRALVLATWLARHKNRARMTVLDGGASPGARHAVLDACARQDLTPNVTWHLAGAGGRVLRVDAEKGTIDTDAGRLQANLVNFVPPHGAGQIARVAGLTDLSGWCPVTAQGRSALAPGVFILGDARQGAERTAQSAMRPFQTPADVTGTRTPSA